MHFAVQFAKQISVVPGAQVRSAFSANAARMPGIRTQSYSRPAFYISQWHSDVGTMPETPRSRNTSSMVSVDIPAVREWRGAAHCWQPARPRKYRAPMLKNAGGDDYRKIWQDTNFDCSRTGG